MAAPRKPPVLYRVPLARSWIPGKDEWAESILRRGECPICGSRFLTYCGRDGAYECYACDECLTAFMVLP